jgi:IMP dehydrogenase/GMP reductase
MQTSKFRSIDPKLDFRDVLLVPRSTRLFTRSNVNLLRKIKFQEYEWEGIPIIASNMDTVVGLESYDVLRHNNYLSCFPKHFNAHWLSSKELPNELKYTNRYMLSCGTKDVEEMLACKDLIESKLDVDVKFLCVDVANGYMQELNDIVMSLRDAYPNIVIIAGNVVTPEAVESLIKSGANMVKCGIGCFTRDTKVLMSDGSYRPIADLKEGNEIITGNGKTTKVKRVIYKGVKPVIRISSDMWRTYTKVTREHNYLVNHKGIEPVQWVEIGKCHPSQTKMMFPSKIEWNLPKRGYLYLGKDKKIVCSYHLGYITSMFLKYGSVEQLADKTQTIFRNLNEKQSLKLESFLKLHDVEFMSYKTDVGFEVLIIDDKVTNYFISCKDKTVPTSKFYVKNKSYIKGLYDGIIESEAHIAELRSTHVINDKLLDTLMWCQLNLHKNIYGKDLDKLYGHIECNIMDSKNLNETEEVWDIEVECESHSFIADNVIVHNSGSVCDTRIKTGVGFPQLSVILECYQAAHDAGGYMISDGGIVHPGDIAKAFGAGTDFVMLGSVLAGHNESPGEIQLDPRTNQWFKTFYGMSSQAAMDKYNGGLKGYRTSEGRLVKMKLKGKLQNTINDINGGLRSACTYSDAYNLEELSKNAQFIMVNRDYSSVL